MRFVLCWDIRLFSTNIRPLALAKYLDHLILTNVSDMGYLRNQVVRDADYQKFGDARHAPVDVFHLILHQGNDAAPTAFSARGPAPAIA